MIEQRTGNKSLRNKVDIPTAWELKLFFDKTTYENDRLFRKICYKCKNHFYMSGFAGLRAH